MASRIVKSAFWLVACSGLGYGLFALTTSYSKAHQPDFPGIEKVKFERLKQKEQFVSVLQSASESSEPLYRMTKKEIESEIRKSH